MTDLFIDRDNHQAKGRGEWRSHRGSLDLGEDRCCQERTTAIVGKKGVDIAKSKVVRASLGNQLVDQLGQNIQHRSEWSIKEGNVLLAFEAIWPMGILAPWVREVSSGEIQGGQWVGGCFLKHLWVRESGLDTLMVVDRTINSE